MSPNLDGRVVAITGAARGIGLATAERLLASGAKVAVGDLDEQALAHVVSRHPGGALSVTCLDVRDPGSFAAFLDQAEAEHGPLDVLINNAGVMPVGPLLDEQLETARLMFDVNVHGVINGIKTSVPRLAGRPGARIVNVASYAAKLPVPGQVTYSGSKAAVLAITEGARWELRPHGIAVTAVIPSFTNTELIAGTPTVRSAAPVQPQDVAQAIVDAITAGRDEVYVPRRVQPIGLAMGMLPRRLQWAIHHRLGTDRAFIDLDLAGRSAYDERIRASAAAKR